MVLTLDIGGSYIKAGLFDSSHNKFLHILRASTPAFKDLSGAKREICPTELMNAVDHLLYQMSDLIDGATPLPLLISNQMHGTILVNSQGQPQTPLISWQDTRCLKQEPETPSPFLILQETLSSSEIRTLGNELKPGLPITTLPCLLESMDKGEKLYYLSFGDYVALKLTNLHPSEIKIHSTNAAATGLFNFEIDNWDQNVIQKLKLSTIHFPEITKNKQHLSDSTVHRLNLQVYTPFGDQQVALLGAGLQQNQTSLNIATGSQVSRLCTTADTRSDSQLRPFFNHLYLKTITHIPAGRALNAYVRLFCEVSNKTTEEMWAIIHQKSCQISKSKIKANVSVFKSEFGDSGSLNALNESNLTIGEIFFSLYKNMSQNYYQSYLKIEPNKNCEHILFSGGLILKNDVLRKVIIDQFHKPKISLSPHNEDVLMGLAKLSQNELN